MLARISRRSQVGQLALISLALVSGCSEGPAPPAPPPSPSLDEIKAVIRATVSDEFKKRDEAIAAAARDAAAKRESQQREDDRAESERAAIRARKRTLLVMTEQEREQLNRVTAELQSGKSLWELGTNDMKFACSDLASPFLNELVRQAAHKPAPGTLPTFADNLELSTDDRLRVASGYWEFNQIMRWQRAAHKLKNGEVLTEREYSDIRDDSLFSAKLLAHLDERIAKEPATPQASKSKTTTWDVEKWVKELQQTKPEKN
jgi:hypothetical protein